ncbi:hypothetical protein QO002_005918 [Pararhizobium capsulatum DSM 1112]|uniref:Uncharacterized protein n=1 Tax=Pararhizobium capsulatum DSM 1112 TaxID=1121113 RepID=A0ABU0BZM2_9HYPH|nr:hypothetical protein [Pararhizobium capsulatum]MDQ0323711.1 hypothetical protein [Pararhizobium capsulatum DSM 1112]
MQVDAPKFPTSHPDRALQCQANIEPVMQEIIAAANAKGWGTVETMSAMEDVLCNLLVAYEEDPDPEEDPDENSALK